MPVTELMWLIMSPDLLLFIMMWEITHDIIHQIKSIDKTSVGRYGWMCYCAMKAFSHTLFFLIYYEYLLVMLYEQTWLIINSYIYNQSGV